MIELAKELIDECVQMKNKGLDLSRCVISDLEELPELLQCDWLETLDLSYNMLPDVILLSKLLNLKALNLRNNWINNLSGIGTLQSLTELVLSHNRIPDITPILLLPKLKKLDLSNNWLTYLPKMTALSNLEELDVQYNNISKIKPYLGVSKLKKLLLAQNQISSLSNLGNLPVLEELNAQSNEISDISHLSKFSKLRILKLDLNKIYRIPSLKRLTILENLDIQNNYISNINFSFKLPRLKTFYANGNRIKVFPYTFFERTKKLEELYLSNNPIKNLPEEFLYGEENIIQPIKDFLNAQSQGQIINIEAKAILFGNGESGKTTLSHQLRNKEFSLKAGENRTHGILIKDFEIPYSATPQQFQEKLEAEFTQVQKQQLEIKLDKPKSIRLKMWDFGGQEYYHATHRLFMNSNVLYLLVWDEQSNFQDEEKGIYPLEYWRENINTYAEENITIEIQNKVIGSSQTNSEKLQHKVHFRTENEKDIQKYELDISDLEDAIFNQLENLEYLGKPFPKVYDDIRQALRDETKPCLSFADYEKLCRENDFTQDKIMQSDSQIETLTYLLHETGSIICYHFKKDVSKTLRDYVFLKPEWVTDCIYKILSEDLQGSGEFDLAHIEQKIADSGVDATVWASLMHEFELVFENPHTQKIIAPQYLPKECTEQKTLNWALKGKKVQEVFVFHFPKFLPKNLFLRFIAKYGVNHVDNLYWKNGLVFDLLGKTVHAVCDYRESTITIKVQEKNSAVTSELYRWFSDKISERTLISADGGIKFRTLTKLLDPELRQVYEEGFWFLYSDNPKRTISRKENNMTIQELKNLVERDEFERLFQLLDNYFDVHPNYQYSNFKQNIAHQLGQGQSPNPSLVQGIKIFLNGEETQKAIEYLNENAIRIQSTPRQNPTKTSSSEIEQLNILYVSARPHDKFNLRNDYDKIKNRLGKSIQNGEIQFELPILDTNYDKVLTELKDTKPTVLHYSGHGSEEGICFINNQTNKTELLTNDELEDVFENRSSYLKLVFLNSCLSMHQAKIISQFGIYVLGLTEEVEDALALSIGQLFYLGISAQEFPISIEKAIRVGCKNIIKNHSEVESLISLWKDGLEINFKTLKPKSS
jgi:GTPase SAR1 family protein